MLVTMNNTNEAEQNEEIYCKNKGQLQQVYCIAIIPEIPSVTNEEYINTREKMQLTIL